MNTLLSIRTNIIYSRDKKDSAKFNKHHELIFLTDKPKYIQTNGGEIVQERAVEEMRFIVSERVFGVMLEQLNKIKDADESELV